MLVDRSMAVFLADDGTVKLTVDVGRSDEVLAAALEEGWSVMALRRESGPVPADGCG